MFALSRRLTIIVAAALALAACGKAAGPKGADGDMSMGPANAKVTVVEYASLSCPHCARFNNDVFPAFKKKYIDTGLVHYTFREFLTEPVAVAAAGSLLAHCAGKDKYFSVVDAVFHGQDEIFRSGDARGVLLRIAQTAGMTEAQFETCVSNEDAQKALAKKVQDYGDKEKISATPTFIINGKKIEGEQTMATMDAVIQPLLAK